MHFEVLMDLPFTLDIHAPSWIPSHFDNHILRKLSSMKGQYYDTEAYDALSTRCDYVLYEVYEIHRPVVDGELLSGVTFLHPGMVGNEYNMTKGHFHAVLDTAEFYYCLAGTGAMVMETPEGEWSVKDFRAGRMLYVPPRWAHRSVNTSKKDDLVLLFVYPAHAGHDYGTIEKQGFRKLMVEIDGRTQVIDNPRWSAPGAAS
jgi:glucose-6-phosphate isomerase, archaeal